MAYVNARARICDSATATVRACSLAAKAELVLSLASLSFVMLVAPSLSWAQQEQAADLPSLPSPPAPPSSTNTSTNQPDGVASPTPDAVASPASPPEKGSLPVPAVTAVAPPLADAVHASSPTRPSFNPNRYLGLGLDFGISGPFPDAGLLLIGRPTRWAHIHAGVTTNSFAFGARAGVTLVSPFFVPLSLTCEVGHFFEGDANTARHWVSDDTSDIAALRDFSYDYVNVLGGLAFTTAHMIFFVRAGTTWMRANVHNFQRTVHEASNVDVESSDPKLSYRGPSLRLGFLFFL